MTIWAHVSEYSLAASVSVWGAYRRRDKRHTVPAFTLLHCVLLGADLGKFAIQNNFLKRIFFRLMNIEFGEAELKLHIATTGDHFVAWRVSKDED